MAHAGPRPDASTLELSTCEPCHASGRAVPPWDAIEIYPDFPGGALRQGSDKALALGFGDLLPLDSTALEWRAWQDRLDDDHEAKGRNCLNCHLQEDPKPVAPLIGVPEGAFGDIEVDPDIAAMHAWLDTPSRSARAETMGVWVDVDSYRTFLVATVKVLNYGAGHRAPTGADGRNILLTIEALGSDGSRLTFVRGPVIPELVGAPHQGEPGFLYARLLADAQGKVGVAPGEAATVFSDSRLQGGEHDELHFTFLLPETAPEDQAAWSVEAKLWWRSALGPGAREAEIEVASKVDGKL